MAAPKGNKFWKLRSKHGRKKIFETPEIILQACYEYFDHQSRQVWNKIEYKGRELKRVEIPTPAPFTMTGMCLFLGVNTRYFTEFEKNCSVGFSDVIKHVREVIYTQKFEVAAVGVYNANIIARDLGLFDKKEVDITSQGQTVNIPPIEWVRLSKTKK